jgi:hypothetical protein
MNDDSKSLYFLGGSTAILSGLLMIFIGIWFIIRAVQPPDVMHGADVMHGVSVVMLILVVPTVLATTVLLIKDAKTGALLGVGFAVLWIVLELIAYCSQTAPLKTLNELIQATATEDFGKTLNEVWHEWGQALTLIGAFLFSVAALCYGISLRSWGNPASAYLLIFSAIVFAITFIPDVSFYWHILIRGIAFLFLGGVLMQASREKINEEWEV